MINLIKLPDGNYINPNNIIAINTIIGEDRWDRLDNKKYTKITYDNSHYILIDSTPEEVYNSILANIKIFVPYGTNL